MGNSSGWEEGSSTIWAKMTALAAARGAGPTRGAGYSDGRGGWIFPGTGLVDCLEGQGHFDKFFFSGMI
ncbi:hypothetical protein MASR2M79_04280 [Aminivibrio sp.]